jgi:hypothetical protein
VTGLTIVSAARRTNDVQREQPLSQPPPETEGAVMTKFRTALVGAAAVAALVASCSAGFAQGTPEQRAACTGDAFRFCSSEIPNVAKVTACMKANYAKLSPGCKAAAAKG